MINFGPQLTLEAIMKSHDIDSELTVLTKKFYSLTAQAKTISDHLDELTRQIQDDWKAQEILKSTVQALERKHNRTLAKISAVQAHIRLLQNATPDEPDTSSNEEDKDIY
jgi:chromosome segregation ATPase